MLSFIQQVQSSHWTNIPGFSRKTSALLPKVVNEKVVIKQSTKKSSSIPRSTPKLESTYHDDAAFSRVVDAFLSEEVKKNAEEDLSGFADAMVSEQVMHWIADAEAFPAHIQHWDAYGGKKDELVTSQGWKYLWQLGMSERLAALPTLTAEYQGSGRLIQLLKFHLFSPSSATSGFHLVLSDGVAALLLTHLKGSKIDRGQRELFQHAYDRLTSADYRKAWTSGLWMTERTGGSDLTPTETTAVYSPLSDDNNSKDEDGFPLGPWVLNGLKWFSTGTEASMAVVMAKTTNGLSAFYVPMRRTVYTDGIKTTELNGVRIRRLKRKVGTKPLPTSELDLQGMRGWLIGKEGKGIQEVGVVLNITRIHLAVGVLGYAGRALSASRAFARVRKVARGTQLSSVPLHMRTLAKVHVAYRAQMMLSFFVASLLAKHEGQEVAGPLKVVPKSQQDASLMVRLLGSVAKASAAMEATKITQAGMESLGGLGYTENEDQALNVARLWRDAAAVLIGEGTTDVLATDAVKVMKGKIGSYVMAAYGRWIKNTLPKDELFKPEVTVLNQQWSELQSAVSSNTMELLTLNARDLMESVFKLTSGVLLLADAARDNDAVAIEVARRCVLPAALLRGSSVKMELEMDQQIVFGGQERWSDVE